LGNTQIFVKEAKLPINLPEAGDPESDQDGLKSADEANLVRQAQAGDELAFSQLVRPYMRLTYHVALRITCNREDAEDASQQSLLKAYTRIDQFQGEAQFSTWLTRIAINEALMKVRKRRSEDCHYSHEVNADQESSPVDMLSAGEDFHPEALFLKWENQRSLREAISDLHGASRAVVWLLGIQERKTKETARILNMSESAVKSRFLRARQQLRQSLAGRIS
jgi:RNA polymerase sigma-70 factor (ECF subfamily)